MIAKRKNKQRKPKAKRIPQKHHIRKASDPDEYFNKKASWAISRLDRNGQWGWDLVSRDEFYKSIHPWLKGYETMNWQQITAAGSHNINVERLILDAQKRLDELDLDDLDELFSLALGSVPRIWGVLDRGVLKILWYDPEHQVYPVSKGYT